MHLSTQTIKLCSNLLSFSEHVEQRKTKNDLKRKDILCINLQLILCCVVLDDCYCNLIVDLFEFSCDRLECLSCRRQFLLKVRLKM